MNRCILIAGMPASGKTTFAEKLEAELRLPMISKDRIKELMYDNIGFHSRTEKAMLGSASMEILYYYAETLMRTGQPFILENNFENVSKPQLKSLLEQHRYRPLTIRFGGDMAVIYERYLAREQSAKRHKGHTTNEGYPGPGEANLIQAPLSADAFAEGVEIRGIRDFSIGGEELTVDTTHFEKVSFPDIVARVKRFLQEDPLW